MKDHFKSITVSGVVTAVFAHRFVIEGDDGKFLADLGPEGARLISLRDGDRVTVSGEGKPSEIKVVEIAKGHDVAVRIEHTHKKHGHHDRHNSDASPGEAINAVTEAGFIILQKPRRKPKHFEILGRSSDGTMIEFHVEFDGHIRKRKPVETDDPKWHV